MRNFFSLAVIESSKNKSEQSLAAITIPLRRPLFTPVLCGKGQSAKVNESFLENLVQAGYFTVKKSGFAELRFSLLKDEFTVAVFGQYIGKVFGEAMAYVTLQTKVGETVIVGSIVPLHEFIKVIFGNAIKVFGHVRGVAVEGKMFFHF